MRREPLKKTEKDELRDLLKKLGLLPPVAGAIALNVDGNGQVATVELQKAVWR